MPPSVTVLEPGLLTLPVDFGRTTSRALGVPLGGAADRMSFQLANVLLGNSRSAPALEVTLKGPSLRFHVATVAALVGAPFEVAVNGRVIPANTSFEVSVGDLVRIGGTPVGCRAYLAVAGGFELPEILGSHSALEPLRTGDGLHCRSMPGCGGRGLNWSVSDETTPTRETLLRVLPGAQFDWFPSGEFFEQTYRVSPASNRMGIRLLGEPISKRDGELVSEPVAPGAVQVTHDGLPIVLGVDGQTIGGYPKVAHVIRADMDRLGQLRPGDLLRFELVNFDQAELLAQDRAREFRLWQSRLTLRLS